MKMVRKASFLGLMGIAALLLGCESPYSLSVVAPQKQADKGSPSAPSSTQGSVNPVPQAGTGNIVGLVVDATNNNPIANAKVVMSNGASAYTDGSGHYAISSVSVGSYSLGFTASGYIAYSTASPVSVASGQSVTVNAALSPVLASGEIRIVLSWTSKAPGTIRDIDGYLKVPNYDTPVFYANCDRNPANSNFTSCTVSGAYQDVDATQWVGPETITITNQSSGTYTYYIANYNNYCDSTALGNSSAVVSVYNGDQMIKQYRVPQGSGVGYKVFTLTNGVVTDVNQYMTGLNANDNGSVIKWTEPSTGLFFNSASNCDPYN